MYKISYTNFNQIGGVSELKPYRDFDGTKNIQDENFTYNAKSYGKPTDRNQFNSLKNTVNALKYILITFRISISATSLDLVDILKDIKAHDDIPTETPGTADANYGDYKDKSLQELSITKKFPNGNPDRRKWIKAVLNINRIYLEKLAAAAAAASVPVSIPVPSAVAAPPSLTNKKDENKLNDQEKAYVKAYMVALNEVSKLNDNAIMTPQLMDFFNKSGFEVNPMGYDMIKTKQSNTFSESDLLLLLTIGGYKLKSNTGNPVYSRF